ncbi:hypothetical protein L7F22_065741 [Adiantum nelumboides]|nr:hypothetical protein [Adiantum nelumboides]
MESSNTDLPSASLAERPHPKPHYAYKPTLFWKDAHSSILNFVSSTAPLKHKPCPFKQPGSKDRHSKVATATGLRDRRVRLSPACALQLFDIQHKLGLEQPSQAVDWLLQKAKPAIAKLHDAEDHNRLKYLPNEGSPTSPLMQHLSDHHLPRVVELDQEDAIDPAHNLCKGLSLSLQSPPAPIDSRSRRDSRDKAARHKTCDDQQEVLSHSHLSCSLVL